MTDAKKIEKTDNCHPKTKPKINNSFISPPPIDSFLKTKSQNNFNKYIDRLAIHPFPKLTKKL